MGITRGTKESTELHPSTAKHPWAAPALPHCSLCSRKMNSLQLRRESLCPAPGSDTAGWIWSCSGIPDSWNWAVMGNEEHEARFESTGQDFGHKLFRGNCSQRRAVKTFICSLFFLQGNQIFFFSCPARGSFCSFGVPQLHFTSKLSDLLKKKNHNLLFWELFLGRGLGCTKFKYSQVTLKKLL